MADKKSRLGCSIDLAGKGKQLGYLTLTWSDNKYAHGPILVPIAVISGAPGKTALLAGGTHGDEYEGQLIARQIIAETDPAQVTGRIIVLPSHNYLAVTEGLRCATVDNVNLNRAFPGDADGSPTMMLAHFVETAILPLCDVAMDLHSGGRNGEYLPVGYLRQAGDAAFMKRKLEATRAFGAPMTVVVGKTADDRSLSAACDRVGVPMIASELGGQGAISMGPYRVGYAGVRGVLAHYGILEPPPDGVPAERTRYMSIPDRSYSAMTPADGLFMPAVVLGDEVKAGDLAGTVYPLGDLTALPVEIRFQKVGTAVARKAATLVRRGEFMFHTAIEVSEASLAG
ncbi:MAG: succinylglutamate desuccinylase [Alphaproteobacteria bacterium]|nr:succinylglutamate desuccinylase [Alphaproteobacteria bacterium]